MYFLNAYDRHKVLQFIVNNICDVLSNPWLYIWLWAILVTTIIIVMTMCCQKQSLSGYRSKRVRAWQNKMRLKYEALIRMTVPQPPSMPVLPDPRLPFTSNTLPDTALYAHMLACLILSEKEAGRRVIITLEGVGRGAGKTTLVTAILKHFSATISQKDAGAVSFIAVKEYRFMFDGEQLKVVHIDPDYKGHQHLPSLHGDDWDVLFFEHGNHPAFGKYRERIEAMGDTVVHYNIAISDDEEQRVFTMTSPSGASIETPAPFSWEGLLVEENHSPDSRLSRKQVRALHRKFGKDIVIMSVESSCDDTCIVIMRGKEEIFRFKMFCQQENQQQGKEGIDPLATAKRHAENFAAAEEAFKKVLQEQGIKVDLVSVTQGPGLAFALLEGIAFAQKMAVEFGCPIMYLDHIKGHAISARLAPDAPQYPYITFVVSGGHTVLLLVKSPIDMQILYTTPNGAIGEVIDKICRAMGIPCVPAGPEAEKLMDAFPVPKVFWYQITSKTKDKSKPPKEGKKKVDEGVKPEPAIDSFPMEYQSQLRKFRDVLAALDKCLTPADIKRMFCNIIRDVKLRMCGRSKLLATYINQFCKHTPDRKELSAMTKNFGWESDVDGTHEDLMTFLQTFEDDDKFVQLVKRCHQIRLGSTLEQFCSKRRQKATPSILKAFIHQLGMKVESICGEDVAYICWILPEKQRPDGTPEEILVSLREAVLEEDSLRLVRDFPLHEILFTVFIREYDDMTPLPLEEQQFYCACMHSVLLSYQNRHLQEGVIRFADVKHISYGGGVACSKFFSGGLKALSEKHGLRFTVVPIEFCADNAPMMWNLTIGILEHLFKEAGECTCGDDHEQEAPCESCEMLRNILYKHGCGALDAVISKDVIAHAAGDRWDAEAKDKFSKEVPDKPPVLVVPAVAHEPDGRITPSQMWDAFKSKNGNQGTPLHFIRELDKVWDGQRSPLASWIAQNRAVMDAKFTNKLRCEIMEKLLSTDFFGHGYQAFKEGKPVDLDKKAYNPIMDFEAFFQMLSPGAAAKP